MPDPDLAGHLRDLATTRESVVAADRDIATLVLTRADLLARRDQLVAQGAAEKAATLDARITDAEASLLARHDERGRLVGQVADLSNDLVSLFTPESLTATLDGAHPVAMLPVRIETRFTSATRLRVRVFPDQVHVDAHDPALTADEQEAGRWYWAQRWAATPDDTEAAPAAWQRLVARLRPGRAAYVVSALTPRNQPGQGDPDFPDVATREAAWSRAPLATALPDRVCVVGLSRQGGGEGAPWVEQFRQWGSAVPDALAVGPDPRTMSAPTADGGVPGDEGTRWLREPAEAESQGVLVEVEHPSLAQGVERLVVLGVDWTQSPEEAAGTIETLLRAQRYAGHLGLVPPGAPTNSTSDTRSTYSSDTAVEAAALDPVAPVATTDEWSAGTRLARALGVDPATLAGVPGADLRVHAWESSLADALWRGTAGYYLSEMLDPLARGDTQLDADLREFTRSHVFACGPLPTLRVGAQPYGVLPVVASRSFRPGPARAEGLVHQVAGVLRDIVSPAIGQVPRLRRAGESQDVDSTLLALLQRTPVPWTLRFRPVTGPVERKSLDVWWEVANAFQRTWTTALWSGLHVHQSTRLSELTLGRDSPLPVPLVVKPDVPEPTSYLAEIADLTSDPHGRQALNLRENSSALLEAMAAHSALLEIDRTSLQATRDRLGLTDAVLAELPGLLRLSVPTPDSSRVEPAPTVPRPPLDFRSGRELADAVVPQVSAKPLGEFVTAELHDRLADLAALLGAPTDPWYWLGHHQVALRELAQAPPDQLEWAFRGFLDLFSTRLDAWFTALATARLADHRAAAPTGVHVGCWGLVEDLQRDTGPGAESLGFVHTPSLSHAVSTALLRNGRLANRGDDGQPFDLQVTSERVRRGRWLLDGTAQGQSLAALLGYRLERGLRDGQPDLTLMRYQMPMRRTAPLRGPDVPPDASVEVLAARDVVDGVTLLDRWRTDPDGVLDAIAAQTGGTVPSTERTRLRAVIDAVHDSYDAVSDLLVAESVHQAAVGNLERAGAALSAHDRHGRAPDLDYVGSPRSGHTVAHRVALAAQSTALPSGWSRDARGAAEPMLDAWVGGLLGSPADWRFAAVSVAEDGTTTVLDPVGLADLGLGPISTALACQGPGQGRPTELQQRVGLAFAAQAPPDPTARLELLADGPDGGPGLAVLETLGTWIATLTAASPLTATEFVAGDDLSGGLVATGAADLDELEARVATTLTGLGSAVTALAAAGTDLQRSRALLGATAFAGSDAVPVVPLGHPEAGTLLADQVTRVHDALVAVTSAVTTAMAQPLPAEPPAVVVRHTEAIRAMLGAAQPVLPRWRLSDPATVTAALSARTTLLGGEATYPATWLQRTALVRPELEPLAGLLLHREADGHDAAAELHVVQQPHRPDAPWLARPFGDSGIPPHGSVGLVVHAFGDFDATKPFAGVLVDGWTETVPADQATTAVTFHYDAPGAAAPQAVLLAVHPDPQPGPWSFDLLLETVNEAADLARLRTLSSAELAPLASFLPAIYLPDDYTHDVPSVSLKDLVLTAKAAGFATAYADVLGKA